MAADEQFEDSEQGGSALSVDRAISAVRKRLKLVVAMSVVAASLVAVVVMSMPNRYDASAIIQIDPRQKSVSNIEGVIADLKGDTTTIESEVEIIRSRPIILQVINTLNLRHDPEFVSPPFVPRLLQVLHLDWLVPATAELPSLERDPIGDMLKVEAPGASRPEQDEIADAFFKKMKVMRVRNTLLIDIRYSANEASKAARIANTIAEVYLNDQLQSKTRLATTATSLLEAKLDDMRQKVSAAERKVEQWKAEHNIFETEGHSLSEKQLSRLMEQTVTARNATSEARAKYEQAQKLARTGDSGSAIVEVLQSAMVRSLKEQVASATRKSAELQTKYGAKHPEMLKVNAERNEAETQLTAEIARQVSNLKNEAEVAEGRERQLAQSLNDLKEQQVVSKDASVELKELEREASSSKQLFESLLVRYKQTAETQGFQLPDVRIIEKADAPQFPASPKRKQLILIAGLGGLVLGLALAVLLEMMAPGVSRQDEIERVFSVAHLSSVPAPFSRDGALSPSKAVRLVVAEPAGLYADAIRGARRELDMHRPQPSMPRIILVTSSIAGEGAELIASNLAHNYAMTGSRPLLIDGDMRLQLLTRQLAAQRRIGLLDTVLNRQPLENAILRDGLTGLNFLPAAGPQLPQSSIPETLNSKILADALASLKTKFDTVIISVPPLLPVIDGRILADYADQIVFVVAWQKTPKQLAKTAIKTLGLNERKIAGVILNDVALEALSETRGWPKSYLGRSRNSADVGQYAA